MTSRFNDPVAFDALSRLLLCEERRRSQDREIFQLNQSELDKMLALANSHHVVVRALEVFRQMATEAGAEEKALWADTAIQRERQRIDLATSYLTEVCAGLESVGCDVTVIKSLDHWPDLGSDLDLYTNAAPEKVIRLMRERFSAEVAYRSWGDRLANKWNFQIPGLPEAVEIHMGRLGQTGEQVGIARMLAGRARLISAGERSFQVPAAEDRLMICTLQRMYRHFYARLCDIVDTARLLESEPIDYELLRSSAQQAGIWEGVATFLVIASDYAKAYRGRGLDLPYDVRSSARFGGAQIYFGRGFLRIPILPHSAKLYASQLTTLLRNGELRSTVRLGLLPCLATAAAVGYKITGSDKGIW